VDIKAIMKVVLFTPGSKGRWGLPVIFEGEPGTAKTNIVEQVELDYGLKVEVILGSIREPTDVGGLARLEDDRFRLVPPAWALDMAKALRGVVFLDELNTNVPAMQAAMLRLATDGAVGEYKMPHTVRILAAQNKVGDAAGGWDLAPPLANRFGHLAWEKPDARQWSAWLLGGGEAGAIKVKAADLEARVEKEWAEPFARAKGLVSGFITAKPSMLHMMPKSGSPEAGRAWPSHRTWELGCRAWAGAELHRIDQADKEELLTAFIGVGAAAEFLSYIKEVDLPDPADVLDGNTEFKHDVRRLDRTVSVLASCAALIAPDKAPKRKERAEKLWEIIGTVIDKNADIVVDAAMVLAKKGFTSGKSAYASLAKIQPILAAAGFVARSE
jgi:hypothetical protein